MQKNFQSPNNKFSILVVNLLILVIVMACSLSTRPATKVPENTDLLKTEIVLEKKATSIQATMDAVKNASPVPSLQAPVVKNTDPPAPFQPTQPNPPTQPPPPPPPTEVPTATITLTATIPPSATPIPDLIQEVSFSTSLFYCYQEPSQVTISVKVSDIERGMFMYYRIKDKETGNQTDWEQINLHRGNSGNIRTATLVGGWNGQNIHFPAMMHESWLVLQIISDDGSYRSKYYSDVTFIPCAQ